MHALSLSVVVSPSVDVLVNCRVVFSVLSALACFARWLTMTYCILDSEINGLYCWWGVSIVSLFSFLLSMPHTSFLAGQCTAVVGCIPLLSVTSARHGSLVESTDFSLSSLEGLLSWHLWESEWRLPATLFGRLTTGGRSPWTVLERDATPNTNIFESLTIEERNVTMRVFWLHCLRAGSQSKHNWQGESFAKSGEADWIVFYSMAMDEAVEVVVDKAEEIFGVIVGSGVSLAGSW